MYVTTDDMSGLSVEALTECEPVTGLIVTEVECSLTTGCINTQCVVQGVDVCNGVELQFTIHDINVIMVADVCVSVSDDCHQIVKSVVTSQAV
jgi:hypothetical protein